MDRPTGNTALETAQPNTNSRIWLLALIGLVAIVSIACGSSGTAPPVSGDTFTQGEFDLGMHEGKPVLVNFWFPSCPPCRAEMPDLQAAYEIYGDDVVFVGIQQLGLDSAANGQAFVRELGLTYPNMPDVDSTIQFDYQVFSFPSTVFLDKNHDIARNWTGIIGEEQLAEQLDALLAG